MTETGDTGDSSRDVDSQGNLVRDQGAMEDVHGAPTWPIPPRDVQAEPLPPPVGLNWGTVASRLGIDLRVLLHDGAIVLIGESFPEAGYFIDPSSFLARKVDVGDRALARGYFIGELTANGFGIRLPVDPGPRSVANLVVRTDSAPILALFGRRTEAERAKHAILRGSLGSGVEVTDGPLGVEIRVKRVDLPGRVATVIAAERGAIISVGGATIDTSPDSTPVTASASVSAIQQGDARRPGTGATGQSVEPRRF